MTSINMEPMGFGSDPLWYEIRLEDKYVDYLNNIVNDAEKKQSKEDIRKTKSSLVGNISKSFNILEEENKTKYFSKNYLNLCIKRWMHDHNGHHPIPISLQEKLLKSKKLDKVTLDSFWANHQYKYEFNPPHNHSGIYSFVIWLKIPYNCKSEALDKRFTGTKIVDRKAGCFEFLVPDVSFTDSGIITHTYELEERYEGTMLFFPSGLMHQVFPFYSTDEKRISLSGNINFNIFLNDEK